MQPRITYFKSSREFRNWLEKNHAKVELWLGFYKKDSGKSGITYKEAVDQALCFGWIDGVKKRVNELRFMQRFSPRKSRSVWSLINKRRAKELKRLGMMTPSGLAAFEARTAARTGIYSFENRPREFSGEHLRRFRADAKAWEFFQKQPPGYRRLMGWRVVSAKREETRDKRLMALIVLCRDGRRMI
jgi:uncharacterized protein YdeI (YjbR/CyaY-like superfamily)